MVYIEVVRVYSGGNVFSYFFLFFFFTVIARFVYMACERKSQDDSILAGDLYRVSLS